MTNAQAEVPSWMHSSLLADLRKIVESNAQLRQLFGDIARFRIVIDANAVISEINHMVRYPERGKTALQELVHASVLEVVAPRWLEQEMDSAISQFCERRKLDPSMAWEAWDDFSELIVWDNTVAPPTEMDVVDPKDAAYIWTRLATDAVGVLTNDPHIEAMGAKRLSLDFVFDCRSYARAQTVSIGIVVNGVAIGFVALAVLKAAFSGMFSIFVKVPARIRWAALILFLLLLIFPASRKWFIERGKKLLEVTNLAGTDMLSALADLAVLVEQKRSEADDALQKATSALDVNS